MLHVGAQLRQRRVGRLQSRGGVLESVLGVGQLGRQAVPLVLQLDADRRQLLHLSTQLLVLALSLAQSLWQRRQQQRVLVC